MTAQAPDRLLHRGQVLDLCTLPLEPWLRRRRRARRPAFLPDSSANWRGYVATWAIEDGHLYLTDIEGWIRTADGDRRATLGDLFPRTSSPVLATWVIQHLQCNEGRLRAYVHAGFESLYERERILLIDRGELVEEWLAYNPPTPLYYLIGADGSRTYAPVPDRAALAPEDDPFAPDAPVEPWRVWGRPDWGFWKPEAASDGVPTAR